LEVLIALPEEIERADLTKHKRDGIALSLIALLSLPDATLVCYRGQSRGTIGS
jgi:hypothetical protein